MIRVMHEGDATLATSVKKTGEANPVAQRREQQRRSSARVCFLAEMEVSDGTTTWTAMSEDVSQEGMCFVLEPEVTLEFEAEVSCRIKLPALDYVLEVPAQVRWSNDGPFGQRVGVRFLRGLRAREAWAVSMLARA